MADNLARTEGEADDRLALLELQLAALRGSSQELGALMSLGMTEKMATIVMVLVRRYPAVISRETLHQIIYGDRADGGPEPKIFDVQVSRIRRLLRREGAPDSPISTIWGSGYQATTELVFWVQELYKRMIREPVSNPGR